MVGVPGFLARFLTRFLARFLTRVFDQVFLDRKYSVQYYWDRKNTVLQYYRDGKTLGKNHVIKNPMLLNIPYIKNLAVWYIFVNVPSHSLAFSMHFLNVSRHFARTYRNISWRFPGFFCDSSRNILQLFLDISMTSQWNTPEKHSREKMLIYIIDFILYYIYFFCYPLFWS